MQIVRCDQSQAEAWDAFVRREERASFYHLFQWKAVNEESFGHQTFYLAAMDEGRIQGVFPLVCLKGKLFGKILCSLPFVNYGGPCTVEPGAERLLLEEARTIVEQRGIDYLEIRSARRLGEELLTSEHKVSMTLDLAGNPEVLWKAFKTKHRTSIRHAYKNDLSVRRGGVELLDTSYNILSESWRNLGTPIYQKGYFERVLRAFPQETAIFVVDHCGVPIATAVNGYFRGMVEGMWFGTRAEYRRLEPTYVLYWEMIKDACEQGFQRFHLGRSTVDSGGEAFKKKWNAYPTQLYWQYFVRKGRAVPPLNASNPKLQLAMSAWRRLPLGVTRVLGPMVAKGIP
jgi:FemAB-related protein (PEP-CTERM system-associated)